MTEYLYLVLYLSSFVCLCALVCLYFSGCQEMTYKHDGENFLEGNLEFRATKTPCHS